MVRAIVVRLRDDWKRRLGGRLRFKLDPQSVAVQSVGALIESPLVFAGKLPLAFDWRNGSMAMEERLRTDSAALAMIEDYRKRFSSALIGVWVDCIDQFIGIGFGGVSGKFSRTEVREDGTGCSADEEELVKFEWRRVRERVIEVRCVGRDPAPVGWTDEEIAEDREWQQVEYDFVVPELVNSPTITDVSRTDDANFPVGTAIYRYQFLECFTYRFGGLLRFEEVTQGNLVAMKDHPRVSFDKTQSAAKPWWKWW